MDLGAGPRPASRLFAGLCLGWRLVSPVVGDFDQLFTNLDDDPRVRGRQFEHVCKWFFENDPVYRSELRRVWLWDEWPGRWGGDAGIDLVAEDRNGGLWAIQAKAYDPKYRVSKKDVDKFLAESGRKVFSYRMLIATTDLIDRTGERTIQQQEKRSSFFRLNDLRAAAVDWPASPALLRPTKRRKPAKPRPHQAEAIRDVLKGFKTSERGQLIMACGTGKTLTGLFIAEKLKAQRTLVLLPSLSLLKQTLNEWRANCTNAFASLPVCSDDTVTDAEDAAVSHTSDLNVPAKTDPNDIAKFLRRKSGPLVVFSTYQSSPQIERAFQLGRVPGFDLIIADEAHRVAGPVSSDFGTVLDPKKINGDRRLFMTATPRYFTGRVLKAAQEEDYEIASMDDETKFGPVFHRLSFGEAIRRDLLTDYQVAIVGVDDATYRDWAERGTLVTRDGKEIDNAATLAGQIGLAKAMRKYNLRRIISFHSRVKRAREFAASMPNVIDWMPARQRPKGTLWSDVASGEMPAGDRYVLLQQLGRLESADRGLLANARCLSEGVDVPTLDGVAFIDPRRSEVDIVQAVGRAIRLAPDKTVGTVVIPVFVDTDEDVEIALDNSAFKPVWDVIQALRSHDEELGRQLDTLRRELGRLGGVPRLPDKIHLDLPRGVTSDFARAFDVRLVEQTTLQWEFWLGLMDHFIGENGNALVPSGYKTAEGYSLGGWVSNQRHAYRIGRLDAGRQNQLENLHPTWTWEPYAAQWEEGFSYLCDYIEHNGHARVPQAYKTADGYRLGGWTQIQRTYYGNGRLDTDRQIRLENLHPTWVWEPRAADWEEGFGHLCRFIEHNGHARIPSKFKTADGFQLGAWIGNQRAFYRNGTLDAERQTRLENLHATWTWEAIAAKWEEGFSYLCDYIEHNGDARVPRSHKTADGYSLGAWTQTQRTNYRNGRLDTDRQTRLENLHPTWIWDPYAADWEEGFGHLCRFIEHNGHARIPSKFKTADGFPLGNWFHTQRAYYRNGKLDAERQTRLETLHPTWTWDAIGDMWEEGFSYLCAYIEHNGDAGVPQSYKTADGYSLGSWVHRQLGLYRDGKLDINRQTRLENLHPTWRWDPRAAEWEFWIGLLDNFIRENGHARVPQAYKTDEGYSLGSWINRQRAHHRGRMLDADRRIRLENLHPTWTWEPRADEWEEAFGYLCDFIEHNGHARVRASHKTANGYLLGRWVIYQRILHRKGELDANRQARLERLHPTWTWDAHSHRQTR